MFRKSSRAIISVKKTHNNNDGDNNSNNSNNKEVAGMRQYEK